ncbi:iron-containing alcohol dehydrogenase [Coprococcus eutactus]|uniref:iron-containing alcohol dehydrogenase n=1 Tax=Coprococcus eutactus TaxID=33043 RepID=UPI003A7F350E
MFAWVSDTVLPLVLIPTTCGTGSEGNGFAVLTNPENGDKKSLRCNAIVAKVSIVDPDCMKTMPKHVLAAVGFDALCHCMERHTHQRSRSHLQMRLHCMRLILSPTILWMYIRVEEPRRAGRR